MKLEENCSKLSSFSEVAILMSHILSYEIDLELQLYATKQITTKQISYSQMFIISEEFNQT
jgi:hypothetical protein